MFCRYGEAFYDGSSAFGRQLGVARKNRFIDTFNNEGDFVNVPVIYFNSSSPATPCLAGTQLSAKISAAPNGPSVNGAVTFTASVTESSQPSTGITAALDFDSPYYAGSKLQMYDDGTNGDVTAGDGTFALASSPYFRFHPVAIT